MANVTYNTAGSLETSMAGSDIISFWKAGGAGVGRITKANMLGGFLSGGGTIATGGFTLTVPATGTAALLATPNTFTKAQTVSPSTANEEGIVINMPTNTLYQALKINYNGTQRQQAYIDAAGTNRYWILDVDAGTGTGGYLILGRNSNASTPAAGFVQFTDRGGTPYYFWADDTGVMRVHTAAPVNGVDTSGTVVGAQTSMAAAKHIGDGLSPMGDVLARIRRGAAAVQRFTYRSGAFGGQEFEGVVIDDAPDYGMDKDPEYPAGKALNEIVIAGDLLRGLAWAMAKIEALEARL